MNYFELIVELLKEATGEELRRLYHFIKVYLAARRK